MIPGTIFTVLVTAYCAGPVCGALGTLTKSGVHAVPGYTAACDPHLLPLGTMFIVEGVPGRWRCEDVGSAVQGRHVDLYLADRKSAIDFGSGHRRIRVIYSPGFRAPVLPWGEPGCPVLAVGSPAAPHVGVSPTEIVRVTKLPGEWVGPSAPTSRSRTTPWGPCVLFGVLLALPLVGLYVALMAALEERRNKLELVAKIRARGPVQVFLGASRVAPAAPRTPSR